MLSSLLYVSRSLVPPDDQGEQLLAIQALSHIRNVELDLTGFLVSTQDYFSQYLEGDADAVSVLMQSIRADTRHTDIKETPLLVELDYRLFPHWRMTCFPTGCFVSRHVEPILSGCFNKMDTESVISLIQFVRQTAPDLVRTPAD
nr:BLUF domain-containing protein [Sphingomonas aerophila]